MPVLVCEDVGLRERPGARAEAVAELVEEVEVDVDLLVDRAVERPDVGRGRAAPALRRPGEEDGLRRCVALHRLPPVRLDAVDVAEDPAVLFRVRVGAGRAARAEHLAGRLRGDRLPVERPEGAARLAVREELDRDVDDHPEQAEAAAADGDPAAGQAAAAADVFDLGWIQACVRTKAHV
jgi:hypothetical protein